MRKKIKDLVKDPEWQKVRKSLLNKWNSDAENNCKILRHYLGAMNSTTDDKLRIVMNYLVGTGFRTGRNKNDCISDLRSEISIELRKRKFKK